MQFVVSNHQMAQHPPPHILVQQQQQQQQQRHQPNLSSYPTASSSSYIYAQYDNAATTSMGPSSSSASTSIPSLNTGAPVSSKSQTAFRAPAHKHAHHLHSIPPREKSTRTLIIDHMLWVHGRTRFSQARAELGMTDRTGGPNSPNYAHRNRPENYDEDDEEGSEGEDVETLIARSGGPDHPHNDDEEDRLQRQDLVLARSLRLRAEGLEKVVTSMLEQPPPIHTKNDEDILTPPTSPKLKASMASAGRNHPHRLPNGVRLRLALGTLINDLFARQAPAPPYRHTMSSSSAKVTTPSDQTPTSTFSTSDLPDALTTLAPISGAFAPASYPSSSRPIQNPPYPNYPQQSYMGYSNQPSSSSSGPQSQMHVHYQHGNPQQQHPQPPVPGPPPPPLVSPTKPRPSARTRSLYAVGADPSTANAPAAFRCPRHLHTGCEICVEAKSPARQTGSSARGRSSSTSGSGAGRGGGVGSGGGGAGHNAHARTHSGTAGLMKSPSSRMHLHPQTQLPLAPSTWKNTSGITIPGGGGITGWQDGSGIGSGLLRPGVRGSALRRKVVEVDPTTGAGNTKLSVLIPRFVRMSALVAAELGRESRGEEEEEVAKEREREREREKEREKERERSTSATPGRSDSVPAWGGATATPSTSGQSATNRMYDYALRPSSEWYMLLAGLLTRAVLEGYLSAGWTGLAAVQCLLQVGLGLNEGAGRGRHGDGDRERERDRDVFDAPFERDDGDEDDEFGEMDPDELPSVVEAVKILFPSLRDGGTGKKAKEEEEYEREMMERLRRFYDIPASTPDCATHMEDLAWQYPAEPVERAAVRFCEAIARWRGKPELETYKKKPRLSMDMDIPNTPGGSSAMTIESLVHSNPTSPVMANAGVGDRGGGLGLLGAGAHAGGSGGIRRKRKKPSIDVYFLPYLNTQAGSVTPRLGERSIERPLGGGGGSGGHVRALSGSSASWSHGVNEGMMGGGGGVVPSPPRAQKRYREDEGQNQGRMDNSKRRFS
ncbi:hypothetical protein CVT24_004173 [Panaeolus cyanescens]|uniref:Uncharacterized protein n=1 Tax=Panaeolus cyanescens TaxID=181874 RepID=A0A409W832_9AGAR|nr:hypothetical protein CVT24_004173 [Panaeolus cyanescens]